MIYAFAAYALASLGAIAYLLYGNRSLTNANNATVKQALIDGKESVRLQLALADVTRSRDAAVIDAAQQKRLAQDATERLIAAQKTLNDNAQEIAQHVHDKIASGSPAAAVAALNELFNKPLQAAAGRASTVRAGSGGTAAVPPAAPASKDPDPRLPGA